MYTGLWDLRLCLSTILIAVYNNVMFLMVTVVVPLVVAVVLVFPIRHNVESDYFLKK